MELDCSNSINHNRWQVLSNSIYCFVDKRMTISTHIKHSSISLKLLKVISLHNWNLCITISISYWNNCYKYRDHSINKVNFVEGFGHRKHCLKLGFFQGNQYWRSFYVQQHFQRDLLYWSLHPELFLCRVFTPSIVFSFQVRCKKPMFSLFVSIFYKKILFRTHHTLFGNFHMVCICQPLEIWWQISV